MRTAYFINIRNMRVTPRRWFGLGRPREEREVLENRPQPAAGWMPLLHALTPLAMKLATAGVLRKMVRKNRLFQRKRKWWEWK